MFFPVNIIFDFLLSRGMKEKTAGPVAYVAAAIAALLFLFGAYQAWKAVVISEHETEKRADEAEKTIRQIEEAEGTDEELRTRDGQVIDDLEEGARNAQSQDPGGAAEPSGPVSTSVHDGLRERRQPR